MNIKVKVKKKPTKISVNATMNTNETAAVVKNTSAATNYDRLDHLKDVIEGDMPADGSTLIYDQETDKYEVKKITLGDIDADLDGGSF